MRIINKKAFTLVELLAVIVVLAIIMVIAFGSVTRIIEKTRRNAFVSTYNLVIKNIKEKIKLGDEDTIASLTCYNYTSCANKYGIDEKEYSLLVVKDVSNNIIPVMFGTVGSKFENIKLTDSDVESKYFVYDLSGNTDPASATTNSIASKISTSNAVVEKYNSIDDLKSNGIILSEDENNILSLIDTLNFETDASVGTLDKTSNSGIYTNHCNSEKVIRYGFKKGNEKLKQIVQNIQKEDNNNNYIVLNKYLAKLKNKGYDYEYYCIEPSKTGPGYIYLCKNEKGESVKYISSASCIKMH